MGTALLYRIRRWVGYCNVINSSIRNRYFTSEYPLSNIVKKF